MPTKVVAYLKAWKVKNNLNTIKSHSRPDPLLGGHDPPLLCSITPLAEVAPDPDPDPDADPDPHPDPSPVLDPYPDPHPDPDRYIDRYTDRQTDRWMDRWIVDR